jgi:hypothetical protein
MVNDYICKIGICKIGLARDERFKKQFACVLVGEVTDKVFGEPVTREPKIAFARENGEFIQSHAEEISRNEELYSLLAGAAYNTCCARYIDAGDKRRIFSNPFFGLHSSLTRSFNRYQSADSQRILFQRIGHSASKS